MSVFICSQHESVSVALTFSRLTSLCQGSVKSRLLPWETSRAHCGVCAGQPGPFLSVKITEDMSISKRGGQVCAEITGSDDNPRGK